MVFFGEYLVSFTGAGRMVIPKKIRELLPGSQFVLTKGFDHCLNGYSQSDWQDRAKSLLSVSLIDKTQLEIRRFVFSSAVFLDVDEQGRCVVPKHLLSHAGISEKVLIAGVGDHFEVWNPDKWSTYMQQTKT